MEEILQQIKTGFKLEKDALIEFIGNRVSALKEYEKYLDSILAKVDEIVAKYRKELAPLISERVAEEKRFSETKDSHAKQIADHVESMKVRGEHSAKLEKEIADKEEKHSSMDRRIGNLLEEGKRAEAGSNEIRSQYSTLERNLKEKRLEEKAVSDRVEKLKAEEATLINGNEEKKKEFTRLSSEVATLEARLK